MIYKGKVWKFGDNISSDLMMPGEVLTTALGGDWAKAALHCMQANRPAWAAQVQKGDIIVAGSNWGCGSGRPGSRVFQTLGVDAIVADSMSRLFLRNAVNIGLPVLLCKGVSQIFEEGDTAEVNMDTGEITNLTRGKTIQGEALPADSPPTQMLRAGGLTKFWRKYPWT